jgi:hypothetical protein
MEAIADKALHDQWRPEQYLSEPSHIAPASRTGQSHSQTSNALHKIIAVAFWQALRAASTSRPLKALTKPECPSLPSITTR